MGTPDVEYLTEEELERIEILSYPEGSLIGHVRDLYVFVCYAAGIRYRRCVAFEMGQCRGETVIAYDGENQIGPEYSVTVQSASHFTTL